MEDNDSKAALAVECYSGHTYAQEPRAFTWRGRRWVVKKLERAWRTPEGPCFVVQVEGAARFRLVYREHLDQWRIVCLDEA